MLNKLKQIIIRSIGIILFAFIPGAAVGGPSVGWFMGGVLGCATVFSSVIIFFGVQLAWDADITQADIEKGFRAAVAKNASDNKEVAEAVKTSKDDSIDWADVADFEDDLDELDR